MTPQRPVGGVIVYVLKEFPEGRKVLFLKRSGGQHKGAWWPVAGTPKPGEAALETALRELHEETVLRPVQLFEFGREIPHVDPEKSLPVFVALIYQDDEVVLNYEHSEYRWLSGEQSISQVPEQSRHYLRHLDDFFIKQTPDPALRISFQDSGDEL
jgi:dATP pyrophosphohydrolase